MFFSSSKSVSSGGLDPPWVSITALASLEAARPTLGGSRPPLETLLPEEKKTSSVKSVSHVGKSHSSTLAVIPYAEFMFSYATRKKLTTPFLNQKWVFHPLPPLFCKKRPKKGQKMGGKKNLFSIPREEKSIFLP